MNMRLSAIVVAIIGIVFGVVLYKSFCTKEISSSAYVCRIAIFEPAVHPAMDEIADGFMTTMKKNSSLEYRFDRYNANGNKTLLRAQAEEIIQRNYDLIMSIGADPTRTLHELTTKKHITTPIVFDAVSDPVSLGIIASAECSGNHITGVEEVPDYEDQLNTLLKIKPAIKNILLVYDPIIKAGVHELWARDIENRARNKNITVTCAKVFHTNDIQAKVQPLLTGVDVVMILTDHTTVSGIDTLITLCNRYHVTLYASDLNSGDKGAALSYGVTQYDLGVDAADLALKIIVDHVQPTDLPILSPQTKKLKINLSTMALQGLADLKLNKKQLAQDGVLFVETKEQR